MSDTLRLIGTFLLATGGGGAVYEIIKAIPFLAKLNPKPKRLAAGVVSALLGLVGYGILVGIGSMTPPVGARDTIITLANMAAALFLASQGWHLKDLPATPAE